MQRYDKETSYANLYTKIRENPWNPCQKSPSQETDLAAVLLTGRAHGEVQPDDTV